MSYELQEGVLPVVHDILLLSSQATTGVDPVPAPFLRCVAEYGCPGHRGQERED